MAVVLAGLSACRPCAVVDDAWDERLTRELAEIGPGGMPDTGITDHLRLRLSRQALALATGALAEVEVFRPVASARAFATPSGVSVVAEGEMTGRLVSVGVTAPDERGRNGLVAIDAVVAIHLDAIDRRGTYATSAARATVRAPLVFVPGDAGPRLVVDLANASVDQVEFDMGPMPQGFADVPPWVVSEVVEDMTTALVATPQQPVVLLTWPPLAVDGTVLDLAPSSLAADPVDGSVTLGVVSALRPRGAMASRGPEAPELGYGYAVHPDLWRAALVYLQAVGRTPRRFEVNGAEALDGAVGVAVDRADPRGIELELTTYCSSPPCTIDPALASGRLELVDGAVRPALVLRHAAHAPAVGAVVEAARNVLGALATAAPLELPSGATLVLTPNTLDADGSAVRVAGDARVSLRVRP